MKKSNLILLLIISFLLIYNSCGKMSVNKFYPVNKEPLLQKKFVKLPLVSIKPEGWLKDQLVAQSNGLTGHLDEFWDDLINSAWKGGEGESWERGPYYLNGLVPLAYILEDERLIDKTKPWIEWILSSGQPDGWFGPAKNNDRWPLAVAMKVLIPYYEATKDERVIELLSNYFKYLHDNPPDWPDKDWRGVRAMENAITGYWLYRRTDNPDILNVIDSIFYNSFDWPSYFIDFPWDSVALANNKIPYHWKSDGLTAHVVNIAMAVKYPGLWYQQSKDNCFKDAVYQGINNLDKNHGQAGGRFSGDEHLSGKRPTQGTELCGIVEYMYSLENLFEIFGDPAFGDRLELLAYNCLPGTMTPDLWAHQYDQQANQVIVSDTSREWSTNGNSSNIYGLMPNYPCCLANMHQGWPLFVEYMWMATHDQGIAAVTYGPCEVNVKVADNVALKITEETEYPFDGFIKLKLELSKSAIFPIYLRIPLWAEGAKIIVKGDTLNAEQGTMAKLKNEWKSGDVILLEFPMNIRTETRYNNSVSILRGPLYYSLRIGKKYNKINLKGRHIKSINYMGSTDWEIEPYTQWNYGLILDRINPEKYIKVRRNKIQKFPFSDVGELIYFQDEAKYKTWNKEAPVVLEIKGKVIPEWNLKNNSADDPPVSPVKSEQKIEILELIPYGCARLRITEFPIIDNQ